MTLLLLLLAGGRAIYCVDGQAPENVRTTVNSEGCCPKVARLAGKVRQADTAPARDHCGNTPATRVRRSAAGPVCSRQGRQSHAGR